MSSLNKYSQLEDNESTQQPATRDEISTNPEPLLITNKNVRKRKSDKDKMDKAFLEYLKTKKSSRAPTPENPEKMYLLDVHKLSENNFRAFKINTMILLENLLPQEQSGPVQQPTHI